MKILVDEMPKKAEDCPGHILLKIPGMTVQFGFASGRRVMAKLAQ